MYVALSLSPSLSVCSLPKSKAPDPKYSRVTIVKPTLQVLDLQGRPSFEADPSSMYSSYNRSCLP